MTKFETIGVNRQYEADTIEEANKMFAHSCNVCCSKGRQNECRYCAIEYTHNLVVADLCERKENNNAK